MATTARSTMQVTLLLLILVLLVPALSLQAAEVIMSPHSQPDGTSVSEQQKGKDVEIPQMPGFPIVLEPHKPVSSHEELSSPSSMYGVVLADLDGEGGLEIIHSTYSCQGGGCNRGRVWAWDAQGRSLPGFPVMTIGGASFTPSVADLDGDGYQEIVQVTTNTIANTRLYIFDHLGGVLDGFPLIVSYERGATFGTVLYDLDQDGALEILFASRSQLLVLERDGSQWSNGWPIEGIHTNGTPAIGDVDADGAPEIFVKGSERMHLIRVDGSEVEGWPIEMESNIMLHITAPSVMADLDGDLDLEIVVPAIVEGYRDWVEEDIGPVQVRIYHHDGTMAEGWPVGAEHPGYADCQPLVTDLEGDGELEILYGSSISSTDQSILYAWDAGGNLKPGFPAFTRDPGTLVSQLTAADINGDGLMEVFADAGNVLPGYDGEGFIFGFDAFGNELPGFPLRPHGQTIFNGAIIGDVDRDGDYELAAVSVDRDNKITHINLYDLPGSSAETSGDWLTYQGSNTRSGVLMRQYRGWRFVYSGGRMGR